MKTSLYTFILLLLFFSTTEKVFCKQQEKIDSLLSILKNASEAEKPELLLEIADLYILQYSVQNS